MLYGIDDFEMWASEIERQWVYADANMAMHYMPPELQRLGTAMFELSIIRLANRKIRDLKTPPAISG